MLQIEVKQSSAMPAVVELLREFTKRDPFEKMVLISFNHADLIAARQRGRGGENPDPQRRGRLYLR